MTSTSQEKDRINRLNKEAIKLAETRNYAEALNKFAEVFGTGDLQHLELKTMGPEFAMFMPKDLDFTIKTKLSTEGSEKYQNLKLLTEAGEALKAIKQKEFKRAEILAKSLEEISIKGPVEEYLRYYTKGVLLLSTAKYVEAITEFDKAINTNGIESERKLLIKAIVVKAWTHFVAGPRVGQSLEFAGVKNPVTVKCLPVSAPMK